MPKHSAQCVLVFSGWALMYSERVLMSPIVSHNATIMSSEYLPPDRDERPRHFLLTGSSQYVTFPL